MKVAVSQQVRQPDGQKPYIVDHFPAAVEANIFYGEVTDNEKAAVDVKQVCEGQMLEVTVHVEKFEIAVVATTEQSVKFMMVPKGEA